MGDVSGEHKQKYVYEGDTSPYYGLSKNRLSQYKYCITLQFAVLTD